MKDFEQQVLEDLSALKVQMHQLFGIGQPGRLHQLEQRVECHERRVQQLRGITTAFGGLVGFLQLVEFLLRGKH